METLDGLDWDEALRQGAARLATGRDEPSINFRRDELAGEQPSSALHQQLRRLKAAATLTVLLLCGSLWTIGDRYDERAADLREQSADVYVDVFPHEPVPTRIVPAMRKAQMMLQGTRGAAQELPAPPASDLLLQRILAALPNDLRYRVPEIRVEGPGIYVAGEVRSNADADRLTAALRAAGFETDSPRTQRLADQGFSVRIAGKLSEPAKGGAPK
jgi:hypothetical protein